MAGQCAAWASPGRHTLRAAIDARAAMGDAAQSPIADGSTGAAGGSQPGGAAKPLPPRDFPGLPAHAQLFQTGYRRLRRCHLAAHPVQSGALMSMDAARCSDPLTGPRRARDGSLPAVYIPPTASPPDAAGAARRPLLLYLHGAHGRSDDLATFQLLCSVHAPDPRRPPHAHKPVQQQHAEPPRSGLRRPRSCTALRTISRCSPLKRREPRLPALAGATNRIGHCRQSTPFVTSENYLMYLKVVQKSPSRWRCGGEGSCARTGRRSLARRRWRRWCCRCCMSCSSARRRSSTPPVSTCSGPRWAVCAALLSASLPAQRVHCSTHHSHAASPPLLIEMGGGARAWGVHGGRPVAGDVRGGRADVRRRENSLCSAGDTACSTLGARPHSIRCSPRPAAPCRCLADGLTDPSTAATVAASIRYTRPSSELR